MGQPLRLEDIGFFDISTKTRTIGLQIWTVALIVASGYLVYVDIRHVKEEL